jgi:TonB family protein
MNDNLQYPDSAEKMGIEGKVYVLFNVEKDGTITNVKVGKSVDPDLDQEAVRLVKGMPKWEPGKMKGEPVRVSYLMPINFKLAEKLPKKK